MLCSHGVHERGYPTIFLEWQEGDLKYRDTESLSSALIRLAALKWRNGGGGGGGGGVQTVPEILKVLQNHAKLNPIVKTVKNTEFRMPTPQDVRKKGSKILKLPRFAIVLH